jgi:predicted house-cleaning noncanonical NTP pyrophosphatase (MazG superfamily)
MPKFRLNKLIRDGLREKYAALGQKADYPKLTKEKHIQLLLEKIIEETREVPINGTIDEIAQELGDIQQAINDLADLFGVTAEQIEIARQEVFNDKKGFSEGTFVGGTYIKR